MDELLHLAQQTSRPTIGVQARKEEEKEEHFGNCFARFERVSNPEPSWLAQVAA